MKRGTKIMIGGSILFGVVLLAPIVLPHIANWLGIDMLRSQKQQLGLKFGDMDYLAFVGAVIGGVVSGAITLIGIRWTLQEERNFFEEQRKHEINMYNQQKQDETNELRSKLMNSYALCLFQLRQGIHGLEEAYNMPSYEPMRVMQAVRSAADGLESTLTTYGQPLHENEPIIHQSFAETVKMIGGYSPQVVSVAYKTKEGETALMLMRTLIEKCKNKDEMIERLMASSKSKY